MVPFFSTRSNSIPMIASCEEAVLVRPKQVLRAAIESELHRERCAQGPRLSRMEVDVLHR